MRKDIQAAYDLLDIKGQSSITGIRVPAHVKKAFQKLDEFLPDETVLAVATGIDAPPTMGEQRQMGAGASLGAIVESGRSGRLLVLTETNLWEVRATGRLNGSQPQGIRIPLADITDVRVRTDRRIGGLGAKERYLTIDYMRGMQLETREHLIRTDFELEVFAGSLVDEVEAIAELVAAEERKRTTPQPTQVSVADELAKLAQLRDAGVLTEEEFSQQKTKLL